MKVHAMTAPKFSLGDTIRVCKAGLVPFDDSPGPFESAYTIIGMRVHPRVGDDDAGYPELDYSDGWEYQLAKVTTPSEGLPRFMEWGWESEAKLVRCGYPVTNADALPPPFGDDEADAATFAAGLELMDGLRGER